MGALDRQWGLVGLGRRGRVQGGSGWGGWQGWCPPVLLCVSWCRSLLLLRSQGASKNVTYQEWDKIWTMNKRVIDPVCPRHTAVETEGRQEAAAPHRTPPPRPLLPSQSLLLYKALGCRRRPVSRLTLLLPLPAAACAGMLQGAGDAV